MSEHEPLQDKQDAIEKAEKLREMVQTAGWSQVLEPYIRSCIAEYEQDILQGEHQSLSDVKAAQEVLQYLKNFVAYPQTMIAMGEQVQKEEVAREMEPQP